MTARRASCDRCCGHGRAVAIIGGLLVVAIGLAMVLDLLRLAPRYFQFLTAI